jgi:hypothetical protein
MQFQETQKKKNPKTNAKTNFQSLIFMAQLSCYKALFLPLKNGQQLPPFVYKPVSLKLLFSNH